MPKIFISYGRDESHGQNLATKAEQQLQSAGFKVFRDVNGLKPGDVWHNKLESELESSDLMLLVVSEKIKKSTWVFDEFSLARELGLPIIPIIADTARKPMWLRSLQALDFSEQEKWPVLVRAVCEYCLPDKTEIKKQSKTQKEFISVSVNSANVNHFEDIYPEPAIVASPKPVTSKDGAALPPPGPFSMDCGAANNSDDEKKPRDSVIIRAREAYWNNRLDEAAELYATLIEREPNVIDHKGELGNVFWRQGSPEKAAGLYADIAAPIIKNGNVECASNMVGFIGLFFPDRAADIKKLLATGQFEPSN